VLTFRDLVVYGMVFMVPISPFGVFGEPRMDEVRCRPRSKDVRGWLARPAFRFLGWG
jgi:hypothetical protein